MSNTRLFLLAGLLLTLALAVFVSPLASSQPDGLNRVAADQGFADTETEHALADSPVAGYELRSVEDERWATGVSGAIGVLATFGIAIGVFALVRTVRERDPAGP